jgi:cellobiose phosphorylase
MLTELGGGYSCWKGLALTRWREDATCDVYGAFCYIRDVDGGHVWSTTRQPTLPRAGVFSASFTPGLATFRVHNHDIDVQTEVAVSAVDDVELRRVRVTNHSAIRKTLVLTSYAELVLASAAADQAHPAFEKLFVETEVLREMQAIVCTRRARAPEEPTPAWFHLVGTEQTQSEPLSYETDRARFIGRGRGAADPQALDDALALSDSAGPVLDPVAAIRCGVALEPGESTTVDLLSGVSDTRQGCVELIRKYRDRRVAGLLIDAATAHAQAVLGQLQSSVADARLFAALAGAVLNPDATLRAAPAVLVKSEQGQAGLWRYAISGDLPIVLLLAGDPHNLDLARQLIRAHAYWRLSGIAVDMVVLADGGADRRPELQRRLIALVDAERLDKPGGIFVRSVEQIPENDRVLIQAVARVVLDDRHGPLSQQLERRLASRSGRPSQVAWVAADEIAFQPERAAEVPDRELIFNNGLGGFTPDGREFVITITPERMTPVPWVNILANPGFGTLVSESGSAATWSENAQAFRLTPWSNDPVSDPNTEALYIRDEASGRYWSATLLPCASTTPYVTRHGFGYSVFEHCEDEIETSLTIFVAIDAPVKFAMLKLVNRSDRARSLSVTGYIEWVLGDERTKTAMHVKTSVDASNGALVASNPYTMDFAGRTAFFDVDEAAAADTSVCCDRRGFIGHEGSLRRPAAMATLRLGGTVGIALDPCAAIRVAFTLAAGQTRELVFRLGSGSSPQEAHALVTRWRGSTAAHEALAAVNRHWTHTLSAVQVETPDRSLDLLVNGWLPYQTLACRLWARNAFYQSSGAFGFRDQLQDVMALVHGAPALVREHLLRSAARQFAEGDVQHWWHPPSGRGVRTRCSDDYLWLPLATCRYVLVTGDISVLDEPVHFLEGRPLKEGEASYYDLPTECGESGSLYEHCLRAVKHGLRFGEHGLPLMGAGDWNDGMNLVGAEGRGESVWLAFFLSTVLAQFGRLADRRGDAQFAQRCAAESVRLHAAIEQSAWDGEWYRRGWFDDGSPLGTSANTECRIDSIAQSWSVLSGAADASRARTAMEALDARLVNRDAALIQLLAPPFEHSDPSPGYIQGYVPGVRENGGQYTHAAVWAAMAFAALGDAGRAWELFTMLDPIRHADSPRSIATYKTEPYVIASDVYSLPPHTGRGGWTWYTGSAGWMLRFILESLLGLSVESDQLRIVPCVPKHWVSFQLNYRFRETLYRIKVLPTSHVGDGPVLTLDSTEFFGSAIPLIDDRCEHAVVVRIYQTGDSRC